MTKVIGFDASRAFIKNRTGTENYSFQILKNLLQIDQKNYYVIYTRPGSRLENQILNELTSTKSRKKIDIDRVKEHFVNYSRLWTQAGLAKQTFKDKLDVLFVTAHTLPIIRRPSLKTVVTVHDLGSEYLPQMHQLKQRLYLSFMQKVQLKSATKIIAVSKATKVDLIKKIVLSENKVSVVYEGYNQNLYKKIEKDILKDVLKYFKLTPQSYFLFLGTVQPRKNLERLIKSYADFLSKSAKHKQDLVIVGAKGWLSDKIYELPKELGIEYKVRFLGRVDDKYLPYLYSGATAFVFPSLFEGFGLPILEAQACGCPVITSNVSSMPEVAGDSTLFINPYDESDIENKLIDILNDKTRSDLIKKGHHNISRFSWEKAAKETLKVLESI